MEHTPSQFPLQITFQQRRNIFLHHETFHTLSQYDYVQDVIESTFYPIVNFTSISFFIWSWIPFSMQFLNQITLMAIIAPEFFSFARNTFPNPFIQFEKENTILTCSQTLTETKTIKRPTFFLQSLEQLEEQIQLLCQNVSSRVSQH